MTQLNVEFPEAKPALRPGDTIAGEASWTLSEPTSSLRIKLAWTTDGQGVGDEPVTVESQTIDQPATEGRQAFTFRLPDGPWSFEGRLFSVQWYVELEESPHRYDRAEFVLSPTGAPIRTAPDDAARG